MRKQIGLRKLESRFSDLTVSRFESNVDQTFKDFDLRILLAENAIRRMLNAELEEPPAPEPLKLSAQSVAGNPTGSTADAVSVPIAENELAGRAAGGNVAGNNLQAFTAIDTTVGAGNIRAKLGPQGFGAVTSLATAANVNVDIPLTEDGTYQFSIILRAKMATAGTRLTKAVAVCANRVSGVLTIEGSALPVDIGVGTGLTLAISATGGDLRVNVANATGETISGRVHPGWFIEDLL